MLRERLWGNFALISSLRIFNLRNFKRRSFDLVVLKLCIAFSVSEFLVPNYMTYFSNDRASAGWTRRRRPNSSYWLNYGESLRIRKILARRL